MSEAATDVVDAVEAGIAGYILKTIEAAELVPILTSIVAGASFFAPGLTVRRISYLRQPSRSDVFMSLTDQEKRTLRLVFRAFNNAAGKRADHLRAIATGIFGNR